MGRKKQSGITGTPKERRLMDKADKLASKGQYGQAIKILKRIQSNPYAKRQLDALEGLQKTLPELKKAKRRAGAKVNVTVSGGRPWWKQLLGLK